jgi:uncharacterized tellurite resistance protein B-like protein
VFEMGLFGEITTQEIIMDNDQSRQVCQLVAGLVVADDDLAPQEDLFVDKMLAKFGIPVSERDVIFPIIDAIEAAQMMSSLPIAIRKEALDLLMDAAVADGQVVPEEKSYLVKVAAAAGVSEQELEQQLDHRLKTIASA